LNACKYPTTKRKNRRADKTAYGDDEALMQTRQDLQLEEMIASQNSKFDELNISQAGIRTTQVSQDQFHEKLEAMKTSQDNKLGEMKESQDSKFDDMKGQLRDHEQKRDYVINELKN